MASPPSLPRRPRNPVALPARQRKAGPHGKDGGALRQAAKQALRQAHGQWDRLSEEPKVKKFQKGLDK